MSSVPSPPLSVEHLSKQYMQRATIGQLIRGRRSKPGPLALEDVSFQVQRGEIVGLLGPNGAGKTTLMKIITTLLRPTSGTVTVCGHDVVRQQNAVRRSIGLVTCDERSFYWRLSGRQNLRFFATIYGVPREQQRRLIPELLDTLDLTRAADAPYLTYSAGMRQKLAIARGLVADPDLILYDEPTRSLDPVSAQNIRAWILQRRAHKPDQSHVIATHMLFEAEEMCDRVIIISKGRLIAQGSVGEIRSRWDQQQVETIRIDARDYPPCREMAADHAIGLLSVAEERLPDGSLVVRIQARRGSEALSSVLERIITAGGRILACESEKVSFDEVFRSLVDAPGSGKAQPQPAGSVS